MGMKKQHMTNRQSVHHEKCYVSTASATYPRKLADALRAIPDYRSIGATSGWLERELVCSAASANKHWRRKIDAALASYEASEGKDK
jgi:hypothetical protein